MHTIAWDQQWGTYKMLLYKDKSSDYHKETLKFIEARQGKIDVNVEIAM